MCGDTLPFVNEWVRSNTCSNGTVLSCFLEFKAKFQKSGKLKVRKLLSSLVQEALKVRHLRDLKLIRL